MESGAGGTGARRTEPKPDVSRILAEFVDADLGRHPALFYDSVEYQLATCAAFVRRELRRGRQVLYLHDDNDPEAVRAAFRAVGIDVDDRIADGDLLIESAAAVYLDGGLDPERMVSELVDAVETARDLGYDGLSVAGENTWCFHTASSFDHVLDFECLFEERAPELPVTAVCQYSLDRFDGESIGKALWTHERIVYRGRVCGNPFYVPPAEFRDRDGPQSNGRLMLEQAYSLSEARNDLERREQRITVLNRTLRHNVRNETNVVLGHLNDVLSSESLDPDARDRIETARRSAARIVRTAGKARYVETTLSSGELEPVDLTDLVSTTVDQLTDEHPAATVTTSAADAPTVLADENLGDAVAELLENAVRHQPTSPPAVEVSVSAPAPEAAPASGPAAPIRLDVANPGPPIPEGDRRALETGRETPLFHNQGIGLWMVKWIVENSHGRLRFPPSDGECRVRIELPATALVCRGDEPW